MPLVTTKEMMLKAYKGGYAIGAFNVDNLDCLRAVLQAAENKQSPVIIACSSGAVSFMGGKYIVDFVKRSMEDFTVPVALHLDHGKSVELCKQCVDLGFSSVMIDASAYDFEENIRQTKEVVEYAHARGVVVEAELGSIAGIEDDVHVEDKYANYTNPEQAVEFVKRTGIDSLAIAIGTLHGAYKFKPGQKPQLRFDILKEIKEAIPGLPLVLHGASSVPQESLKVLNTYGGKMPEAVGIPEAMLNEASKKGIAKINVGTDIRVAYVGGLRKALHDTPEKFELKAFIVPALASVTKLVEDKMENVFCSAGHAKD
ncbi:MAG: class II fructose-1,6-bisphosphate aldolase [Gammaproteobacteria bacterium]|nr:class II fructose-1,6-bisphosphate aldolase [Gammaproteobacteria bacterium]